MIFKYNNSSYFINFKLFPTVCFCIALLILLSLSTWQFKRLVWKTGLIETRISMFEGQPKNLIKLDDPTNSEFQKVFVRGKLINDYEFFMPALSKNGNNGYHILVPIQIKKDYHIIYDTGWIPLHKREKNKRENNINNSDTEISNNSEQEFSAVVRIPGRKGYFQPDNDSKKNFWFFVDPVHMSENINLNIEKRFYLEAVENGPGGYPIGNQTRIYLRNNHLQYALTWLFMTFGMIGVFFFASVRKV